MHDRDIIQKAQNLASRWGRDPFCLAESQRVTVSFCNLGRQPGAYYVLQGYPILLLNERLSPPLSEMVCAHEMGHHFLHGEILRQRQGVKNPPPFTPEMIRQTEREANLFAATFLLPDEAVTAADETGLPPEFLQMKAAALRVMEKLPPAEEPDPCFLRYAATTRQHYPCGEK